MSTNDKELLELAAKAAGIHGAYRREYQAYGDQWVDGIDTGARFWWNPLTDDGDALRLATKLGEAFPCFTFGIYGRAEFPHAGASIVNREGAESYVEQECDGDIATATRRAIVRAAAEIGKAMP